MAAKRETDLAGWYKKSDILGVIFTEVSIEGERPLTEILRTKFETALARDLGREKAAKIAISLPVFPEIWDRNDSDWVADAKLYQDTNRGNSRTRMPLVIKRGSD